MTDPKLDRDAAAGALDLVADSRRRATELRTYAGGGEVLIGWGIAWLVCYLVGQFHPALAGPVWMAGVPFGILWGALRSPTRADPRVFGTIMVSLGFTGLVAAITVAGPRAFAGIISLFVAMAYVMLGIWVGRRYALLGLVMAASVVIGWFVFPAWLYAWLALGGGGSLIAGGLWLKRA